MRAASARQAILLLALASFNAGISLRCVEAMLPQLAADFGSTVPAAASIVAAFGLAYTTGVLINGPLGDRFGKLRIVTIATALCGAASLGCAAAWNVESLAGMRFVTGLFASSSVPLGMAYIGDVVALEKRQATIARFIAGSIFGQTLGPLFGGIFTDWVGWRVSFVVLGVIFLVVAAILFSRTSSTWTPPAPGRFAPFAMHRELVRRTPIRWLMGIGVLETFFFFGAFVFLGAYFKQRFDLSYTVIGLLLAGYGLGGLLYSSTIRSLQRLGQGGMVRAGGILGGVLFLAITLLPDWIYVLPCTVGLGLAFYLLHNTIQTRATEIAPDARASAISLYAATWSMGQASGVAAMGLAVTLLPYTLAIPLFGLGFCALGLWLPANLRRLRP